MATQIKMPKMGLSMKVGIVGKWLKNEGDAVKKGEALLEIMTDKIANVLEAPADGFLLKIVAEKKAKLPIGALLGIIGAAGEDISAVLAEAGASATPVNAAVAAAAPSSAQHDRTSGREGIKISPAARKLAQESNIDYAMITGTGPEGRITREDVENFIANPPAPADARPVLETIPYEGMRQVIGENMAQSWALAAKVTHITSVDMTGLLALRTTINADLKETQKVSVTDLLIKAVAKALVKYPKVNVTLSGDEIKVLKDINIGVAVAIPNGLVVPVVKNADQKSLDAVSGEVRDFAKRARRNKLDASEMTGGTFTITNLGGYGSVDYFTPIINQPESAILGVGRTVRTPAVVGDNIVIRPMMGLSFAFDHRIIDGAPAAEFLSILIKLIEQPHKIFI